jgi:hypothetical protein
MWEWDSNLSRNLNSDDDVDEEDLDEQSELDIEKRQNMAVRLIAITIQRLFRGKKSRRATKLLIWIRYNEAAFIIQKHYNCWKSFRISSQISLSKRNDLCKREQETNRCIKPINNIGDIANNHISFDDKTIFWRSMVELKRAHPHVKNDVLLKALIESHHDLRRAIITTGNHEYSLRYDSLNYVQEG